MKNVLTITPLSNKLLDQYPYISIIIPVYNGRVFLDRCLDAIFASSYKAFEVIVVDDCSTDDSAEIARKKGAEILATSQQSGPAAARNLAAKSARGEILMFIDADVVVKSDTIEKIADRFESDSNISALFGSYDDEPAEKNFLSQYKNLQHHFVHQNSSSTASTFWSGLGAIRKEIFLNHNGFDCELFTEPSIEDIELGVRLRASGHEIVLDRDIQAKHLKKWKPLSHLRTEIFCRALPWSKLIFERQGMINDMNLKTADRLSAMLVALSLILVPLVFWRPVLSVLIVFFLLVIAFLNRKILGFFAKKKGIIFAALTFPWQLLYFLYSGVTFVLCWFWFVLPKTVGLRRA